MDDIKIIRLSQSKDTPITAVYQPNFVYRYAYARSAENRTVNKTGQDYLEIRENLRRLVFVLCDGVGVSFFGDFAARFLGNNLSDWFWHNCSTNHVDEIQKD